MRLFIVGLFLSAVAVAAFYPYPVYISAAESLQSAAPTEEPLHFWSDKKHAGLFRVGSLYQLENDAGRATARLFSITYATARPGDMKLGFYFVSGDVPPAVTAQQTFRINALHSVE